MSQRRKLRLSGGSPNTIPRDCATSGYKRVIHDPATWRFLQETYLDSVEEKHAAGYRHARRNLPSYSGFQVAVEVKDDGHRGRSVYAKEFIEEGTHIWKPAHLVRFHTPLELRNFLGLLDHDLQCDALLWAYVEKNEGYVALALDPASFVNHGETEDVINLDEDCKAIRDIQVGEELLENYTHFIGFEEEDETQWFNRIRGQAWLEEGPPDKARTTDEYNLLGAPKVWGSAAAGSGFNIPPLVAVSWLLVGGVLGLFIAKKFAPARRKQKDGI